MFSAVSGPPSDLSTIWWASADGACDLRRVFPQAGFAERVAAQDEGRLMGADPRSWQTLSEGVGTPPTFFLQLSSLTVSAVSFSLPGDPNCPKRVDMRDILPL